MFPIFNPCAPRGRPYWTPLSLGLVCVATWLTAVVPAHSAPASSFDHLYAEANEGGSSGGHTALRFGDEIYHFQNVDGLLVLERERTTDFLHEYALVNNRTIVASRIAAEPEDVVQIRQTFDRRYLVQQRQLDTVRAVDEDHALLALWTRGEGPAIPGLGYFETIVATADSHAPNPAVVRLRERITQRYGPNHLAQRESEALARLRDLAKSDPSDWEAAPPRDVFEHPPFARPWSRDYVDTAASVAAFDVLDLGLPLDRAELIEPTEARFRLKPEELRALRARRAALEDALVRLAGSPRTDWGRPFLVGLARLLAMDISLAEERLVVLDVIPEDAPTLPVRVAAARPEAVSAMLSLGHAEIEALRTRRAQDDAWSEGLETRLENVTNRVFELEGSLRAKRDVALARGVLLPLRARTLARALPARGPSDPDPIRLDQNRIRERKARVEEGLRQLYRYQLITRNCVTEIFRTLEDAVGGAAGSERVLGGYVDGNGQLGFIPFVAARTVDRRYRVVEQKVLPSYREILLEGMRQKENDAWVALRESNTLTARSYRRGYGDSLFLFFTDDRLLLRPILGAFNLMTASLESLAGLVWAPIDRGETLVSGLEGLAVSLPELAFWNIRKGSNDWVAPRPQSIDGGIETPWKSREAPLRIPDQSTAFHVIGRRSLPELVLPGRETRFRRPYE